MWYTGVTMASHRAERIFYILLILITIVAFIGLFLLIMQAKTAELALFELLAFSISITAVILAILGAISNVHQARVTRRIVRDLHQAVEELHDINADNESIKRAIGRDYALAKDIAEALAEAGMLDDDARHQVARQVEHKVRTNIARKN